MRMFQMREVVVPVKSMFSENWVVPGVMSRYTDRQRDYCSSVIEFQVKNGYCADYIIRLPADRKDVDKTLSCCSRRGRSCCCVWIGDFKINEIQPILSRTENL